jgi:hypothetical protein
MRRSLTFNLEQAGCHASTAELQRLRSNPPG